MNNKSRKSESYLENILTSNMSADVALNLVARLQQLDRQSDAYTALLHIAKENPKSIPAKIFLAKQAYKLGKYDKASEYFKSIIKFRPDKFTEIYPHLIRTLLCAGHHVDALTYCDRALSINPTYRFAIAYKYIALVNLGQISCAKKLINPGKYVKQMQPEPPTGFDNIDDFNAYLINHIEHNTKLNRDPPQYSTRGGWQSEVRNLFEKNPSLGNTMLEFIAKAQDKYLQLIPSGYIQQSDWSGFGSKPRMIEAWAVVLEKKGAQNPHIHPSSWLSGAYYLALPDNENSPETHAGNFVVGRGPEFLHTSVEPEPYYVKPEEGTFCLFPSYYWHSTVPVASGGRRICIAFDWIM